MLRPVEWVLLGSATSFAWGFADFAGAVASRRIAVLVLTAGQQCVGVLGGVALVLVTRDALPDRGAALAGIAAGVVSAVSLMLFYKAFSTGRASIVAPISATGTAIPVVYGIARGERPGTIVLGGIALAILGVVLVLATAGGGEGHDTALAASPRTSILFALASACGFGTFLILADRGADGGVPWFVLLARATAVIALLVVVAWTRPPVPRLVSTIGGTIVAIGLLDTAAWVTSAAAYTVGPISTVSVLVGLYPVITVLLAAAYMHERIGRLEIVGVALALAGVGMIVSG